MNNDKLVNLALIKECASILKAGTRQQADIEDINSVLSLVSRLYMDTENQMNPTLKIQLGDIYQSLVSVKDSGVSIVPNTIREGLVDRINEAKETIAKIIVDDFKVNEYEFEEESTKFYLLKEAVEIEGGAIQ